MDQTKGELKAPKEMTPTECLNWCNKQEFATGCEYLIKWSTCKAHTWSVNSGSGDEGQLCSIILPKGLLLISFKERQAGAEVCQAQVKLKVVVEVEFGVDVEACHCLSSG